VYNVLTRLGVQRKEGLGESKSGGIAEGGRTQRGCRDGHET